MEQDIIKPDSPPQRSRQAFSPFGCFIAALGATLLALCLLGAASVTTVWSFAKLLGLPDTITTIAMLVSLIPAVIATIWTAGRAWYVERRLAQHKDVDVPVFKLFYYFKPTK